MGLMARQARDRAMAVHIGPRTAVACTDPNTALTHMAAVPAPYMRGSGIRFAHRAAAPLSVPSRRRTFATGDSNLPKLR
jgi:hypothetical protein